MPSLDELLHPISPSTFEADYDGRKPLHIPAEAGAPKRDLLTWDAFNHLLNQTSIWTAQNLRVMRDRDTVPPAEYCAPRQTSAGVVTQLSPPKLHLLLAAGATVVANEVLQLHEPITRLGAALGEAFGAGVGANIYCSFKGVRAFGTHFDLHDVFAVQTEGEKVWNLYANQADRPFESPPDNAGSRVWFEQSRGPLMEQVRMRPGDVLYLPRGWYHDALATDGPSLHVTFPVKPLDGRDILTLLAKAAEMEPRFREWTPSAKREGGDALERQLKALGETLAAIMATPAFRDDVAMSQARLIPRAPDWTLPDRGTPTVYRPTGRAFPASSGPVKILYDWIAAERQLSFEQILAHLDFLSETDIRNGLDAAEAAGAIQRA